MDEKDQIKQKADLVELVSEYVKLTKAGSNYKGKCPFHNEKTPSFFVTPEMGMYKCFGCGESGDVFSWLMAMEHLSFPEALQELSKRTGVKLTKNKPDPQSQNRQEILQALSLSRDFYHWLLTKHKIGKPALKYLHDRGITQQSINNFKIGWSHTDWDGLTKYLTSQKKMQTSILIKAGLVIQSGSNSRVYDRFRGRIMFPLQNIRQQTLGFSGRLVPNISKAHKDAGKYINTPETDVYHKRELLYGLENTKSHIKAANSVVIVEGELDMISSYQSGVKNIVAIKGSALTEEQINILKRYTELIILALDMDIAGDKAAHKGIQMADAAGLEVKVVQLPAGKDPDDLAQKSPQKWRDSITAAIDVYQFFINSAFNRFDPASAQGKRKITSEILPIFNQITSQVVQSHWISELSKKLDIKDQILWDEMRRLTKNIKSQRSYSGDPSVENPKTNRRQKLEQILLAHYLSSDITELLNSEISELFTTTWIKRLISYLNDNPSKSKQWEISKTDLPPEFQTKVAETLLIFSQSGVENSQPDKSQITKIITNLKQLHIKSDLQEIRIKITQYEQQKNSIKLEKAQKQFSKLTSRLAKLGG